MKPIQYLKLAVALLASWYFIHCASSPESWHLLDNANLLIHEGGHIIFWPFGEFLHVLGGSLTQVLLPLLFVIYFYWQRMPFSAALTLFWAGESLLNVYVYAADALKMQLPLLFGDNSTHDWNWLLIYTGQLKHTAQIAGVIYAAGIICIIAAIGWSLWTALNWQKPKEAILN